jgi:PAS domain S-box-containing protein
VEDVEQDALLVLRELKRGGFDVTFERVDTPEAMSAALAKQPWDIVISDYSMPRFSALLALGVVKDSQLDLPVIIVSGTVGEDVAVEAIHAGAGDFMAKGKLARLIPAVERELLGVEARRGHKRMAGKLRASEDRFRNSERRFQDLFESAPDGIVITNRQGFITLVNAQAERLFGWSREELVGQPVELLMPQPNQGGHVASREGYLQNAMPRSMGGGRSHLLGLRKNGTAFPLDISLSPMESEGELFVVAAVRDITERKRVEESLRESEQELRAIFEGALDGILVADTESKKLLTANAAICGMLGYTHEEIVRIGVSDIHPRQNLPRVIEQFEELLRGDIQLAADIPMLCKDGTVFYADIKAAPIRLGSKDCLLGIFRDITERKRAEGTLRLQSAALNAAANAIVITDPNGTIEWINAAFTSLTGYSADEAIGRNPRQLVKSGVHDQVFYKNMWDTVLAGNVWDGEVTNRRKDGSLYPEGQTITAVRDNDGKIAHFIAVKRDLTEQKLLEAQFLQAQKMEGIGHLAGGVAHDFNNLLTVILAETEFALADLPEDHAIRPGLGEVLGAGQRAASLTRQMLAFSRQQVVEFTIFNLNDLVADVDKMLRRLIGEDIDLVSGPATDLGAVKADRGQIEQVLMNLAINARDAMPDGGKLTIETANVTLDQDYVRSHPYVALGEHVLLAVSDSGLGMSEEVKAQIFEPFFTTKERGKGTGLGLATCFGIVKQAGGHIVVYSEVGIGTTMKVYLPRVREMPDAPGGPEKVVVLRGIPPF